MSPQYLYVFLDEAGDFNFSLTGTRFFTLTTITKTRPFSWDAPLISLKYDLKSGRFEMAKSQTKSRLTNSR